MKKLLLIALTVATLWFAKETKGSITDVLTDPCQPTNLDTISILVSGIESTGFVVIDDSVFDIEDTYLELDIFMTVGVVTEVTPWSHIELIGMLPANNYDLTVNQHCDFDFDGIYELHDTYPTSFTVVPEPSTLLLLSIGVIGIRARCRNKSRPK